MRDQRVVIHSAGTAGLGVADMSARCHGGRGISHEEATHRFWALGSRGPLVDDAPTLRDFQVPYARPAAEVVGWSDSGAIGLAEVVNRARPTILIGTSTEAVAFTEPIVCEMAARTKRPIIMPLSNPDLAMRSPARGRARVDRRAGVGRHRQSGPARDARRSRLFGRGGQQRAHPRHPGGSGLR